MVSLLLQAKNSITDVPLAEKIERFDFESLYNLAMNWLILTGPRIIVAALVFVIGRWLISHFRKWLDRVMFRKNIHSSVKPFLESLIVILVQVLLLVVIMQILGIQLTIFAAAVASLGVTIGLALSGTLQNFACGLLILFLKPFTVGDRILAQGHEGIVESIQIFYTIVRKEGSTVIIPNSKLSNEVIVKLLQPTPTP